MDCLRCCTLYSQAHTQPVNTPEEQDEESCSSPVQTITTQPKLSIIAQTAKSKNDKAGESPAVTGVTFPHQVISRPSQPICNDTFLAESQALVHRYMHRPLPGHTAIPGIITREIHGAMHLCRAAVWIPVLLSVRCSLGDTEATRMATTVQGQTELCATMKAAMLHDSGREGEGCDTPEWEQASGFHCEDHLLALGFCPKLAASCREGIINKDRKDRSQKTLIEKLIHDADCLEVMRVRNQFDIAELDLFYEFQERPGAIDQIGQLCGEVRSVIAMQGDLRFRGELTNSQTNWHEPDHFLPPSPNRETKQQFEFADNAMVDQLEFLKTNYPRLYNLYQQSAGGFSPPQQLKPLRWNKLTPAKGGSCGSCFNGLYQDPLTNTKYYVKEPTNPDSARNEVLMAKLAKALGLNVPKVHLVRCDGRSFVVSEWVEGLTGGEKALQKASKTQLAELFLVASVLGNADIIGSSFDNTLIDSAGNLTPLDWGEAGEYGAPLATKHKINSFCSTVF